MKIAKLLNYILLIFYLLLLSQSIFAAVSIENRIHGVSGKLYENINKRLRISQSSINQSDQFEPADLAMQTIKEIKLALQPFGYFKSRVTYQLRHYGNKWIDDYYVALGPMIKITKLKIQITGKGQGNIILNKKLNHLPIAIGKNFSTESYQKTKDDLLLLMRRQGYLNARFINNKILINLNKYNCSVNLNLDTGFRYCFGSSSFSKVYLKKTFLNRYLNFNVGDTFSSEKLLQLQQDLTDSGYFDDINISPKIDQSKQHQVPVKIKLKMKKRNIYQIGAGYGTNTGIRGSIGFGSNWINSFGHKFNTQIDLSQVEDIISAKYIIPGEKPAREQYALMSGFIEERPQSGVSLAKHLGIAQITNHETWQRTISVDYKFERYRLNKDDPYNNSKVLLPNITWAHLNTRTDFKIIEGYSFSASLRGASRSMFSTISFIQGELHYRQMSELNGTNRFLLHGSGGYTVVSHQDKLPLSDLFYVGGIQTVRGYSYKGLGPGKYFLAGGIEYQHKIAYGWYYSIFYDVGNAYNNFSDSLKQGAGVGIVWQTSICSLNIYLASALSEADHPLRLEISLGQIL